ncbi:MAG: EF2563 family selenium-dependent molybdenum hydroxylase system protein [Synergistaceae bacterium]|jgi:xanthine dehydrogenase accessory factor|nr:EF2563 family selenium-dependent molybdenum hydroxylase system protein [Synergistaceae bacterium]
MPLAIVRGGGDLATGVIYRLWKVGFAVLVLEARRPTAIRLPVSAAQAVYEGAHVIDGMRTRRVASWHEMPDDGDVGMLVDPLGTSIAELRPDLLVDAIMAKRNLGTRKDMASRVIAIGPGFCAPRDVHAVVETLRGHNLGRVIACGAAAPDTGVPGEIGGETSGRVVRSPAEGFARFAVAIGDRVEGGQVIGEVGGKPVEAKISGIVRGLLHPSVRAVAGMKIGDVDPRAVRENCFSISDKSLAIGGGVLEAALANPAFQPCCVYTLSQLSQLESTLCPIPISPLDIQVK